jgi:hypothetical protein
MNFLVIIACVFAGFQEGPEVPSSFFSSEFRIPEIQEELQISQSQHLELTQIYNETNRERNRLIVDLERLSGGVNSQPMQELANSKIRDLYEMDMVQVEEVLNEFQVERFKMIREWSSVRQSGRSRKAPILALNQKSVYERLALEEEIPLEFERWEQECEEFLNEKLRKNFLEALGPELDKLRAVENREEQIFDVQKPFRSFDFLIYLKGKLRSGLFKVRNFGGSDPAMERINQLVQEYIEVMYVEQPDGSEKSIFGSLKEQHAWEESKLEDVHPELLELLGEEVYRDMAMRYLDSQLARIKTGYGIALSRDLTRFLGIQDEQILEIELNILQAKKQINHEYVALQRRQFREFKGLLSRQARQNFDDWLGAPPLFMLRYYQLPKSRRDSAEQDHGISR